MLPTRYWGWRRVLLRTAADLAQGQDLGLELVRVCEDQSLVALCCMFAVSRRETMVERTIYWWEVLNVCGDLEEREAGQDVENKNRKL